MKLGMKADAQALRLCDQNGDTIDKSNEFKRKFNLGKRHKDSGMTSVYNIVTW